VLFPSCYFRAPNDRNALHALANSHFSREMAALAPKKLLYFPVKTGKAPAPENR
jgi:hypothetical protein